MALVRGLRLFDTGDGLLCAGPNVLVRVQPLAADQDCRRSLLRQRLTASVGGLQELALDRIEGVSGRQHLERAADADLAGDAEAVHRFGELGDVEVGGAEPGRRPFELGSRW